MANKQVAICPLNGKNIIIFEYSKRFGVAREKSGNYDYLTERFQWVTDGGSTAYFDTSEEAEKFIASYMEYAVKNTINPLGLDKSRRRFSVSCPHCSLIHKGQIDTDNIAHVVQTVKRACPKTGNEFIMLLWKEITITSKLKKRIYTAPDENIEHLPLWDCTECYATGSFVSFTHVERCSSCTPKTS